MITMHPRFRTKVARRADATALTATSSFALDGCAAVKRILNVGVGVGFVIVVTIVALGGSVAGLMTRNG
jgi:hypothetical protein